MKIVAMNNVTLDGVMQAPGRADEDMRGAFAHGGWAAQSSDHPDPEIGAAMGARMALSDGLPLGLCTHIPRPQGGTSWDHSGGAIAHTEESSDHKRRVGHWPGLGTVGEVEIGGRVRQGRAVPGVGSVGQSERCMPANRRRVRGG